MKRALLALLFAVPIATLAGEYDQYWDQWHQNRKEVEQCLSEKKVTLFLHEAISNLGNAERAEANAEVIENVILNRPTCFLKALSSLPHEQCKTAVRFFVQAPIFHSAKQIEDALKSVKQSGRSCYVS
jgi:hypothetical protein